jgi:tRNA threonylcarbamoyladenosine biosynthesis protein TsaB
VIILAIRTDKPEAELYLYDSRKKIAELKWQAHLKLAETLNWQIEEILNKSSITYSRLGGVAVFKGPGSFTGLRIGASVANALAYSLGAPIVAKGGKNWLEKSIAGLMAGQNDKVALPKYGSAARTTQSKK